MRYVPTTVVDLIKQVNQDLYLPAIQREFVWEHDKIERLFDSIMADFPIGSLLFWKLEEKNKREWPIYQFIHDYDRESPHNQEANMNGINKDILLVLDGQQRITSLAVGLRGSYRYFYYRWRKTRLYLNLLNLPGSNDENPEELAYEFKFREDSEQSGEPAKLWYPVGRILDFNDAEDAKIDIREQLANLPEDSKTRAKKLIGQLHNRVHKEHVGYYYEETSQDYDKVLQVFVRANSAGKPLEYSDLLLATATAKWENLNARSEIHSFTDQLNEIGNGFKFGKDFVLKACLYLCESLPIQYKVKNFTRTNLLIIEDNWGKIQEALKVTVRLIARFGFRSNDVVAPLALLPIAFWLMKRGDRNFYSSSNREDVKEQEAIRRWFVFSTLKSAFGGSSDTTLSRLRVLLKDLDAAAGFPGEDLYGSLEIEPSLSPTEIERILEYKYQGRYTNLVLSLLYPDKYWKDTVFHVDHIYPQSEFKRHKLKRRGYEDGRIEEYLSQFNTLRNLQILTDSENQSKNGQDFDDWIGTRDESFQSKHLIPEMRGYGFDFFEEFCRARAEKIVSKLQSL